MNNKHVTISKVNLGLLLLLVCIVAARFSSSETYAATSRKGYALYRGGVLLNLNDHAGLLVENNTTSYSKPIVHAIGPSGNSQLGSWTDFLDIYTFIGVYKPKNASMSSTACSLFASKARELTGIPYCVLDQIEYSAGTGNYVLPEHVTKIRCDGIVEYVYEWSNHKVGGPANYWDITRNRTENMNEHTGVKITPRKQNRNLLDLVSTSRP